MTYRVSPPATIQPGVSHTFDDATLERLANRVGAMDEVGVARFDFQMSFDHANGAITSVDLTLRLTLRMPVWSRRDRRPQAEQDEWDRFLRALRDHEDGHLDIFRREGPTTYERLLTSTPETIQRTLRDESRRIWALSNAYDHSTDHGLRQNSPHGTTVIQVPP